MSRPSLKKLCVYAILSVAGLVIMVCLQGKIAFHQVRTKQIILFSREEKVLIECLERAERVLR